MAKATLKDGRVITFPDGLPPDRVKMIIQKASGGQPQPQAPVAANAGGFDQFQQMMQSGQIQQPSYDLGSNLQTADDSVRMLATGATLGFGPKIAEAMGGTTKEAERGKELAARKRLGPMADALEIGGSMLPATKAAKIGLTATRIPGVVGKYSGMFLDGMGFGALNAAGHDQDVGTGALIGGAFGSAGQLVGKGVGSVAKAFKKAPVGPDTEALKRASQQGYDTAADAGLVFKPEVFSRTADDIATLGQQQGIGGPLAPVTDKIYDKSKSLIGALSSMKGQSPRLQDIEMAKRVANAAGEGFDADASTSQKIARELRNMIDKAAPSDFKAGDASIGIPAIQAGRENWGKFLKSKKLDKAIESAKDRVGANYTQAGLATAMRQEMKAIKRSKDFKSDWTPTEQKMIKELVRGKTGENIMRFTGLFAPKGVVSGAAMGALGYANAPLALALTGITHAGRAGAAKVGMNRFEDLKSLVSTGKLTEKLTPAQNEKIRAMVRALMVGGTISASEQMGH